MSTTNSTEEFDLIVVGAGPAGSIAARQASLAGANVLLVDRAAFPRGKVCGCCVNAAAVEALTAIGLGSLFDRLGAIPLHGFEWHRAKRSVKLSLAGGYSVSRSAFDQALVDAAISAGVSFRDRSSVIDSTIDISESNQSKHRHVTIRSAGQSYQATGKVVIDAAGLGGALVDGESGIKTSVAAKSHMGLSAVAEICPATIEPGIIYMADGPHGYVGVVRLEGDRPETQRMDIAAAVSPQFVQSCNGPADAVTKMFAQAGFHHGFQQGMSLQDLSWLGTPLMTRSCSPPAAERLFLIGDAAGYVEPFTGEGIAWAIAAGQAVVPHVIRAIEGWTPDAVHCWHQSHVALLRSRQTRCRRVTRMLRGTFAPAGIMRLLRVFPSLASPAVRSLSRSFALPEAANIGNERA